ncbi:MAG: cistern family PEP-CTERM protein [Luteitalea sp.]|nr:cistern family PEP-CTERM protein [Luteitalea sp.]
MIKQASSWAATAIVLALTLGGAKRGEAAPITISGPTSFTINWSMPDVDVDGHDLLASGLFTVNGLSSSELDLTVQLTNDTTTDGDTFKENVLSVGWNASPEITSLSTGASGFAGSVFTDFTLNTNFPSFQGINLCAWAGNNCAGGPVNDGLFGDGSSDTFRLLLGGDFGDTPSVTLDTFAIKFQGDAGSFQLEGNGNGQVPEPTSLLLLGVALALSAHTFRPWAR